MPRISTPTDWTRIPGRPIAATDFAKDNAEARRPSETLGVNPLIPADIEQASRITAYAPHYAHAVKREAPGHPHGIRRLDDIQG